MSKRINNESTEVTTVRYRTQYTGPLDKSISCEPVNLMPSCTEPDLSYSVKDIIARFVRGVAPPVGRDVSFPDIPDDADPFDFINPTERMDFDLSDYTALRDMLDARIASYRVDRIPLQTSPIDPPPIPTPPVDSEPPSGVPTS